MKIGSIMWASHLPMLIRSSKRLNFLEFKIFSSRTLTDDFMKIEEALKELEKVDLLLLYRTSEGFWDEIEGRLKEIGKRIPIVSVGHDPSYWTLSTVNMDIVATCHNYITIGGEDNFTNMLRYLSNKVLGVDISFDPPKPLPWEGLYHPDAPRHFIDINEYLNWYKSKFKNQNMVGILFSRHYWINENLEVEDFLIRELELRGLGVIPAFSYGVKDKGLGAKGSGEVLLEYFLNEHGKPRVDAVVKLTASFLGKTTGDDVADTKGAESGVELLKRLNVPVFQPIVSYYKTIEEWENDRQGLGTGIGWSVAMPEFEGVIEPIIIGGQEKIKEKETTFERRIPIKERCVKLAKRIRAWIDLRNKPKGKRKVAFILHNNPCASVEATVGAGAHLDTLESVTRILKQMKEEGYLVENIPENGKELIETIMNRKAISEFRWTTVDEIVKKGGFLSLISVDEYKKWFNTLPQKAKDRIIEAWGNPPGEKKKGIPPAMVYEGKIVVTGVKFGNAVVCVQPKRGCAGARCDGQVCKILHDPDVPPPHQYLATYHYLENTFGVDVIIHVGTHGNLEFLPEKEVGLSNSCYPDIGIGHLPHLYIYNADNPAEGTIAKRRSYATLVDHMQTVLTESGLYDSLEELESYLSEYNQAKIADKARAHALEHLIIDKIKETNIDKEIRLTDGLSFQEVLKRTHESLTRIRSSQIQDGMHIFGEVPTGDRRVDFIHSILRYDDGDSLSLPKVFFNLMGFNLEEVLENPAYFLPEYNKTYSKLLEDINCLSRLFIKKILENENRDPWDLAKEILGPRLRIEEDRKQLAILRDRILELSSRINESKEIKALLNGMSGRYIPAGPSGLITRGRPDVLPTGRNFYSLDPHRVPTRAAWKVGITLANETIEKYKREEGRIPENIAFYWMSSDIMWSDGEGMSQIMYLLGVEPLWQPNGRIKGFKIIPLEKLKRPRIDVTIRVSGITRDNFPNCIELIDEAIQEVALLDEPIELNYPRKHALEQLASSGKNLSDSMAWREATLRIFASKPGTYSAGVQLAVYASAWKEEKDLSDIFVYWNGYAYGKGVWGQESHQQLINNLKTVDLTFNKVVSDEYDLFGCCCYFGTHGGITIASRVISGKEVKSYYGDTRNLSQVRVIDLADEIRRVVRTKLLNPKWIEAMKRHGYKGAGDISKRIGRVYGWGSTTKEVDDWIFDDIATTFVLDDKMRDFFKEHNPWALEEISRRLLEAYQRGLWNADLQVLKDLQSIYLEIEGWLEENIGDIEGEFQGGSVDIITLKELAK